MLKRIFTLCLCCFIAFCSILPVFASSTFSSDLPSIEAFLDEFGDFHDFAFVFNDSTGYIIEVIRNAEQISSTLNTSSGTIYFSHRYSTSAIEDYTFVIRDLKSGDLIYSRTGSFSNNITITISDVLWSTLRYIDKSQVPRLNISSNLTLGSVLFADDIFNNQILSPLSEPVADDVNSFFVLSTSTDAYLFMLSDFSEGQLDFYFRISADGQFYVRADNPSDNDISLTVSIFNVKTGFFINQHSFSVPSYSVMYDVFRLSGGVNKYSSLKLYGIALDSLSSYPLNLPLIIWNFDSSVISSISASSLLIVSQLRTINTSINNLHSDVLYISSTLDNIYSLLNSIYNSDSSYQPTQPNFDAIQDYDNLESSIFNDLNNNLDSNLNSVFDTSNIVGNNAFAFIRSMLQSSVLDNSKLNSFVFFGLTIGLAVMIIGRKVND